MNYLFYTLLGYISGSILYAYWLPKLLLHKDICLLSADGNPGTANAYTHGGFWIGTASLLLELGKGFFPVLLAVRYLNITSFLFIPVMAAPVLGHAFPFLQSKKGGKAIATSFGVLLGIYPAVLPFLFLVFTYLFFSLVLVIRPHLFRSIVSFGIFSLLTFLSPVPLSVSLACLFISILVCFKHLQTYENETFSIRLF